METFASELERLINKYSKEAASNTPDFMLAEYLELCLVTWNHVCSKRDRWYLSKHQVLSEDVSKLAK